MLLEVASRLVRHSIERSRRGRGPRIMDNVARRDRDGRHSIRAPRNLFCRPLTTRSVRDAHAEKNRRADVLVAFSPLRSRTDLGRRTADDGGADIVVQMKWNS